MNNVYHLDCRIATETCAAVATEFQAGTIADLWHQSLGHLNEQQLKEIVDQNLVKGVKIPKCV